jgi:hypothetical protein
LSFERPEDAASLFQPENRKRGGNGKLVEANFTPTEELIEKGGGEPPKDLGTSDPEMLSKARNTASNDEDRMTAIRRGSAGILVKGESSMGAGSSSAPSSAPNPPKRGAASTSTTGELSRRRSARLIERTAKRQRTERGERSR